MLPPADDWAPLEGVLSADERARLNHWRELYVLTEGWRFTRQEAERLLWTRWRLETGRLVSSARPPNPVTNL